MNEQEEFVPFATLQGSSAVASVIGGAEDMSLVFFTKLFMSIVGKVAVPEGIPAEEVWESLEKRMFVPSKVKKICGKLNVPRGRFWEREGRVCICGQKINLSRR